MIAPLFFLSNLFTSYLFTSVFKPKKPTWSSAKCAAAAEALVGGEAETKARIASLSEARNRTDGLLGNGPP